MHASEQTVIASDRSDKTDGCAELSEFHPEGVAELDLYQKREKIYVRHIEGFYQRIRVYTGWPLLLGYFLLPWLNLNGSQAVLFDLPARKFHIFWWTFWPQDFPMLALILIIAAFALFAVTTWAGRIWCGYSCPQTVWTAVFMWSEQLTEGSRNQRIKRDKLPWSLDKARRKAFKHSLWIGFAGLTGLTFVGYFSPIRELSIDLLSFELSMMELAWILFFTLATYVNAGWMREQVCLYMCPYARFQSVMFDSDTLIVSYDEARGEPRGARKRNPVDANTKPQQLGDCVDCSICVQVCPVGIDIRDGLQYECINCALCIDACDSVMQQMGYKTRLIRYGTENETLGQSTRTLRPRLLAYTAVTLLCGVIFLVSLLNRTPLEVDVIRDRDRLYRDLGNGVIENSYTVKVINMNQSMHRYQISVTGIESVKILGDTQLTLDPGEVGEVPIRLQAKQSKLLQPITTIRYQVESMRVSDYSAQSESRFIAPAIKRDTQ